MRLTFVVLISLSVSSSVYGQLIINGDFEAPASVGAGQTIVGPNESKAMAIDPLHPGYSQSISGIPNWINSFTDVGFGAGLRDAGLKRVDFDGSGDTQYAFINNWETRLSQVSQQPVNPGATLSASVMVGFVGPAQAGRFQIFAGAPDATNPDLFPGTAVLLANVSVASPGWGGDTPDLTLPIGTWHLIELMYTAPSAGAMIGQPITLSFITTVSSVGPTFWDNASLSVVPEPTTMFLAALGLIAFGFTARARRVSLATAGSKFVTGVAVLAFVWLSLTQSAVSDEIHWANFQRRPVPLGEPLSRIWDGLSPELDVTATYVVATGSLNNGSFFTEFVQVTDPDWAYDNRGVPGLTIAPSVNVATYSLTFDYNNPGGLPAGGSFFLGDLESINTTVRFIGLIGGAEVDVDWSFVPVPVAGNNAAFPLWDPLTDTLKGVGGGGPTTNAVFLTSDRALESVRLEISTGFTDGLVFNTAAQPVFLVPEPSALVLGGLAAIGAAVCALGRKRGREFASAQVANSAT